MIKKKLNKVDDRIILFVIVCVQVVFMLFYCNMKTGYFVDEVWSYGLSNSYYHAQIWEDGALDTTEIDPHSFKEYLTVQPDEKFEYGSVLYNQTHDSHPPLFYIVLHTISSFYPEQFSKWFGLLPNILYYVIANIFLYMIARLFVKRKYFALMPVVLFGFSIGAVNAVTYIRMYMMLMMWCLMFAYFHLSTMLRKKVKISDMILLGISVVGGLLTHYFFVIFAFSWVLVYMIWLLMRKDWKSLGRYVLTGGIGLVLVCISYPTYIYKVIGKEQGHSQNMYSNLRNFQDWANRMSTYWKVVSQEMFGGLLLPILYVILFAAIAYVVTHVIWKMRLRYYKGQYMLDIVRNDRQTRWSFPVKREYYLIGIMAATSLFYFVVVSKIAPWLSNRYLMAIYPYLVLLFTLLLYWLFKIWKPKKKIMCVLISIIIIVGLTYYSNDPQYLYYDKRNNVAISEEYSDDSCAYVYSNSYLMVNNALELQNYNKLYHMNFTDLDKDMPKVDVTNSELVLYVDRLIDEDPTFAKESSIEDIIKQTKEITSLKKDKYLFEDDKVKVYLLYN